MRSVGSCIELFQHRGQRADLNHAAIDIPLLPPRRLVHARHEGHAIEDGEREVRKGAKGSCAACMSVEALYPAP